MTSHWTSSLQRHLYLQSGPKVGTFGNTVEQSEIWFNLYMITDWYIVNVKKKVGDPYTVSGQSVPAFLVIIYMFAWFKGCVLFNLSHLKLLLVQYSKRLIVLQFELPSFISWQWQQGCLSGWRSLNALASHHCDPGSIPDVGMWDVYVVTKSDRSVSSGYSGFLPHEDHPNANISVNEHD